MMCFLGATLTLKLSIETKSQTDVSWTTEKNDHEN